ncbi:putative GRAM domain-containing protein [Naja naja]|nr:putative GRAM domain-containing protein [Naja naja]
MHGNSENENGTEEKKKSGKPGFGVPQISFNEADCFDDQKKVAIARSKTIVDNSFLKLDGKNDSKAERKKHSSNQITIPVLSVTLIKKTKTALLVPNALIITTVSDRYMFVSFLSRDTVYKLLKSVCSHLEDASVGNSPNPSPLESSFRADCPTTLPLDFSHDFSELDGIIQRRRKEMEESSSTGSQTPELEHFQVSSGILGSFDRMNFQLFLSVTHVLIVYAILVFILICSTFYMRYKVHRLEEQLVSMASTVDPYMDEHPIQGGLGYHQKFNVDGLYAELTANLIKLEKDHECTHACTPIFTKAFIGKACYHVQVKHIQGLS